MGGGGWWWYVFEHRFLLNSGIQFSWIWGAFWFFWDFHTLVRASGVRDVLQFLHLKTRFPNTCFVDFVSSVVFYKILFDFGCHWGVRSFILSRKNGSRNILKKSPPTWKQVAIDMSGGSQRRRLACAPLKQETAARAQNAVRIGFHCISV